jgi:SAM-dependent methyltransferase/methyltransferase-like protein
MGEDVDDQAYEDAPYPPLIHPFTHPGRLLALATVLGLTPPPVEQARVLELGCGAGGNLLPMAWGLPEATFVGVDLGERHIAAARSTAEALGLANVELLRTDLRELENLGTFDVVIAHGIYSWVPVDVRDRIMAITSEVLAPQGVAMVSFNTLPGWHFKMMVRDLLRFRTRRVTDPAERVVLAREIAAVAAASAERSDDRPRMSLLSAYAAEQVANLPRDEIADAVLLHDELGEINDPVYVEQFIQHANARGLQYLVEADLRDSMLHDLPAEAQAAVQVLGTTTVEYEQYADFFRNRSFRRAVLCRADASLDRTLRAERIVDLAVTTTAVEVEAAGDKVTFRSEDGSTFTSEHALTTAAFRRLSAARPGAVRFRALGLAAGADLPVEPTGEDNAQLARAMLTCHGFSRRMIDLRTDAPATASSPGERPMAAAPARLAALESAGVPNLLHDRVELEASLRSLVVLLDGSRDREALLQAGVPPGTLEVDLDRLARLGLLVP